MIGDDIEVTVVDIQVGDKVCSGSMPPKISVHRKKSMMPSVSETVRRPR